MNYFPKTNNNLITYALITFIIISIFGLNFFISFLGNILLLLFLIPIFLILIIFIGFNFYKSKMLICDNCGAISLNFSEHCMNCGMKLNNTNKENKLDKNPSERTIEVNAEEVK